MILLFIFKDLTQDEVTSIGRYTNIVTISVGENPNVEPSIVVRVNVIIN